MYAKIEFIHAQHIAFFFEIMVKSMAQYLEIMDKMKVLLLSTNTNITASQ